MTQTLTERPFTSGDHCRLTRVGDEPASQHYDCDEYGDGTITSILDGRIMRRPS